MKPFDYQIVPHNFPHCFNSQCPQADECLHRLAALHIPADVPYVVALNPNKQVTLAQPCPHFRPVQVVRYAKGITHLYDGLLHDAAVGIKRCLLEHFGRTAYYRYRRKEQLISPERQEYIRRLFKKYNVPAEPRFDEYVDGYVWFG